MLSTINSQLFISQLVVAYWEVLKLRVFSDPTVIHFLLEQMRREVVSGEQAHLDDMFSVIVLNIETGHNSGINTRREITEASYDEIQTYFNAQKVPMDSTSDKSSGNKNNRFSAGRGRGRYNLNPGCGHLTNEEVILKVMEVPKVIFVNDRNMLIFPKSMKLKLKK